MKSLNRSGLDWDSLVKKAAGPPVKKPETTVPTLPDTIKRPAWEMPDYAFKPAVRTPSTPTLSGGFHTNNKPDPLELLSESRPVTDENGLAGGFYANAEGTTKQPRTIVGMEHQDVDPSHFHNPVDGGSSILDFLRKYKMPLGIAGLGAAGGLGLGYYLNKRKKRKPEDYED